MSEQDTPPAGEQTDGPAPESSAPPAHPAVSRLREKFAHAIVEVIAFRGEWTVIIRPSEIHDVLRFLRGDPELRMVYMVDLCAIHWMDREYEHEVVYLLHSFKLNERIRLKCRLAPGESITTVSDLFPTANWHEREAWDLVGVRFDGHPDLRRILMPEDYDAHPLRRDFPVKGY